MTTDDARPKPRRAAAAKARAAASTRRATGGATNGSPEGAADSAPPTAPAAPAGAAPIASATDTAPRLSDADLAKVLELIKDADSVELKLTIPEADSRATVVALDLDPELPAARAHGLRPLLRHLRGEIDLAAAIEAGKLETRQYVKRQEIWINRNMITWNVIVS